MADAAVMEDEPDAEEGTYNLGDEKVPPRSARKPWTVLDGDRLLGTMSPCRGPTNAVCSCRRRAG